MGCGFNDATKFNLMKIGMQLRGKGRSSRKFRSAFSSDLTPIVHETIFSDMDSRIKHLQKVAKMLIIVGALNILIGTMNSIHGNGFGAVNLLCGCLLMYALGRIHGKADDLKQERMLRE